MTLLESADRLTTFGHPDDNAGSPRQTERNKRGWQKNNLRRLPIPKLVPAALCQASNDFMIAPRRGNTGELITLVFFPRAQLFLPCHQIRSDVKIVWWRVLYRGRAVVSLFPGS